MTCDCSDYEIPTVYRERLQTARKRHRCSECGGTVYPGEQYRYTFGVWDGSPGAFSACPRCLEAEAQFRATIPCLCWALGEMYESAIESIADSCGGDEAEAFIDEVHEMRLANCAFVPGLDPGS